MFLLERRKLLEKMGEKALSNWLLGYPKRREKVCKFLVGNFTREREKVGVFIFLSFSDVEGEVGFFWSFGQRREQKERFLSFLSFLVVSCGEGREARKYIWLVGEFS